MREVILALLTCATIACAHQSAARVASPSGPRFTSRPVHVMASSDMSPECRAAIFAGTVWYQHLGVSIDVTWVPEDHPAISLEPRSGQVAVHAGIPASPNALAETYVWYTLGGAIDKAEVVMGWCDPWLWAHEAGHALGLEHQVPEFELMHPNDARRRWGLSPAERAHVAD